MICALKKKLSPSQISRQHNRIKRLLEENKQLHIKLAAIQHIAYRENFVSIYSMQTSLQEIIEALKK